MKTFNFRRNPLAGRKYLKKIGVPVQKIVLGAAFYGRVYENVSNENNGLFQSGKFKNGIGHSNFEEQTKGFEFYWDSIAKAPYAYNKENKLFFTYDNNKSVRLKSKYVKENGLHGIMFWQLMNDKKSDGLLQVMVNEINGKQ